MTFEEEYSPDGSKKRKPFLNFLIALILSSAPLIVAGILLATDPEYMAQFAYGPPEGAYVPGASVPLGLPIIGAIILLVLIGFVINLLLVKWLRRNKLPFRVIVMFTIFLLLTFGIQSLACELVGFGPTGIRLYKEFLLTGG